MNIEFKLSIKERSILKLAKGTQKNISGWGLDNKDTVQHNAHDTGDCTQVSLSDRREPLGNDGEMAGSRQMETLSLNYKMQFFDAGRKQEKNVKGKSNR